MPPRTLGAIQPLLECLPLVEPREEEDAPANAPGTVGVGRRLGRGGLSTEGVVLCKYLSSMAFSLVPPLENDALSVTPDLPASLRPKSPRLVLLDE